MGSRNRLGANMVQKHISKMHASRPPNKPELSTGHCILGPDPTRPSETINQRLTIADKMSDHVPDPTRGPTTYPRYVQTGNFDIIIY